MTPFFKKKNSIETLRTFWEILSGQEGLASVPPDLCTSRSPSPGSQVRVEFSPSHKIGKLLRYRKKKNGGVK